MTDHASAMPPPGARRIRDAEAPDFIENARVAALAFVDLSDGPSQRLAERFERAAVLLEGKGLAFAMLDVRSDPLVAKAVGVNRVPEIVVFARGREVDRLLGVPPDEVILATLRQRAT